MDWNGPHTDDRAVSPVVGVTLMIAIAVVLAAVVGSLALGIGTQGDETPQASLEFSNQSNGKIVVFHEGGDLIPENDVTVKVNDPDDAVNDSDATLTTNLTAGTQTTLIAGGTGIDGNERITMVWESPSSDETSVIAEFEP